MRVLIVGIKTCLGAHLADALNKQGIAVAGVSSADEQNAFFDSSNLGVKVAVSIGSLNEEPGLWEFIKNFEPTVIVDLAVEKNGSADSRRPELEMTWTRSLKVLELLNELPTVRSYLLQSSDRVLSALESEEALTEDEVAQAGDLVTAAHCAREAFVLGAFRSQFPKNKYHLHKKTGVVIRMPSTQCWVCDANKEGLWSEIRMAQKSQRLPQIKNWNSFRQWYPVEEAVEHFIKLMTVASQDPQQGGVWNLASLIVPPMTVGAYVASLDPAWRKAFESQQIDFARIQSRHPILSLERLKKLNT